MYAGVFFLAPMTYAGMPVWTYSAPSPTKVMISSNDTATIQYTVTNHSHKPKNLSLKTTAGLSASSCYLAGKGTCNLTITVNGSQIPQDGIHSGPVLCHQGNPNQCFQPSEANQLNISLINQPPTPPTPPSLPTATTYTGIYVLTDTAHYSIDNGVTWNQMINPVTSVWIVYTNAITTDSSGRLYMSIGLPGTSSIIYTSDGVIWDRAGALPDPTDSADSLFTLNDTMYTGTANGNVLYTTNRGATWYAAGQPDGSTVAALFVSSNNTLYAGTANGSVFSSTNNGTTWTALQSQPDGSGIFGLAVSTTGTIYVATSNAATALYSTDNGASWTTMGALPPANIGLNTLAIMDSTIYVGTSTGNLLYTTDNGGTWTALANQPGDYGYIYDILVTQSTLSPIFIETSGQVPVNGSQASVVVKNFSSNTAQNVRAQLPPSLTGVTQDASDCTSVAPQSSCTLRFNSTKPYTPQNIAVLADNLSEVISRIGLAFSINGYLVYNVHNNYAYVVDNNDVSTSIPWSAVGSGPNIWGVAEISTTTSPYPDGSVGATQYAGQNNCNGAIDGFCNTNNILIYNNVLAIPTANYAAGLCYLSTAGGASQGDWYLPSICELNGVFYSNSITNSMVSCSPFNTSILSLYSLQLLSNIITEIPGTHTAYWSSSRVASAPNFSWSILFYPFPFSEAFQEDEDVWMSKAVRCVRALPL